MFTDINGETYFLPQKKHLFKLKENPPFPAREWLTPPSDFKTRLITSPTWTDSETQIPEHRNLRKGRRGHTLLRVPSWSWHRRPGDRRLEPRHQAPDDVSRPCVPRLASTRARPLPLPCPHLSNHQRDLRPLISSSSPADMWVLCGIGTCLIFWCRRREGPKSQVVQLRPQNSHQKLGGAHQLTPKIKF